MNIDNGIIKPITNKAKPENLIFDLLKRKIRKPKVIKAIEIKLILSNISRLKIKPIANKFLFILTSLNSHNNIDIKKTERA
jgi:hypothetical protein